MRELFQTTKQNVSLHAKNIFEDGELVENSVVKESLTTQINGKRDLFALSSDDQTREKGKRRADILVRQAGRKTHALLKILSSVARRAKGEILEGIGV